MNPFWAVKWIWIVFGIFWLLAAFVQKRSIRRQSIGSRLLQMGVILVAVLPFYIPGGKLGVLSGSFLPNTREFQYFGVLLMVVGCGFAIWARFILGTNWSGTVTVKKDHVLITRGPYAWVRHPIYTGILLGLVGTGMVVGTLIYVVTVAAVGLSLWLKLRTEETFMVETFGQQYMTYRQRVKALIPYVL